MDFEVPPMPSVSPGLPALAAALLILSTTSQAATNSALPCEQVGRDMQSLAVPVDQLTVNAADHAPIDAEIVNDETTVTESVAPVLNLGPRVMSILRDVFDATTEELQSESAEQPSISPLADSDRKEDQVESDEAHSDKVTLPRFQRQMLRTDI